VPFWTRSQWDNRLDKNISSPNEEDTTSKDDSLPCKSLAFVTTHEGIPITNAQGKAIRKTERHIWAELARQGCDPLSWAKAPITTIQYYRTTMYKNHPELRLCDNHWKVDLLAISDYPSWHRNPKNSSITAKIKLEPMTTSSHTAPSALQGNYTGRKRSTTSQSQASRKKQKHDHQLHDSTPLTAMVLGNQTNKSHSGSSCSQSPSILLQAPSSSSKPSTPCTSCCYPS
jgi:hypothetical protein